MFIFKFCIAGSSGSSHSDNNLTEFGNEAIKEEDRAVLLEGGLPKSASLKLQSTSVKTNIIRLVCLLLHAFSGGFSPSHLLNCFVLNIFAIHLSCFASRFVTMEDSFLLENRVTLRAL